MRKILTFVFALTALCVSARYVTETDIPYTKNGDEYSKERCRLDVYHDPEQKNLPVVVWFHGGGLTGGNKYLPEQLQNSGYVLIAPNYRLIPNVGVDDCIDDAAQAVVWAFENAERFGGDPSKIFVTGHSAGGYLTSMVGLDRSRLAKYGVEADSIAGLIPYSGQVITHFAPRRERGMSELQPLIDETAPLYHVRRDAPPYIIITGDRELELFGRYEENAYMWRMMKLNGHPDVRIYELDGYNHGDMPHGAHHILKNEIKRLLGQ